MTANPVQEDRFRLSHYLWTIAAIIVTVAYFVLIWPARLESLTWMPPGTPTYPEALRIHVVKTLLIGLCSVVCGLVIDLARRA